MSQYVSARVVGSSAFVMAAGRGRVWRRRISRRAAACTICVGEIQNGSMAWFPPGRSQMVGERMCQACMRQLADQAEERLGGER